MEKYIKQFDNCLEHEISFCSASCPFNLDVNSFISRLQEGRFNAAYKIYRDSTGFPFIATQICSSPCKSSCLHNAVFTGDSDSHTADPIELLKLEQACLAYVKRKDPISFNIPHKHKSVAIIGAGISGMACALRLATKKYNVTIYEKSDHAGGRLLDIIDPEIVKDDFRLQMQHLDYTIKFNAEVTSLENIIGLGYNAIYVATGNNGNTFGVPLDNFEGRDGLCTMIGDTAVFLGGSLIGHDLIYALADGLNISTAIDNYTMTKIPKYPVPAHSNIAIDETLVITTKAIEASAGIYSEEEAIKEAKRCLRCQCNACQLHCDLLEYEHKWPLTIRDEILATTAPGKSELHATPAVRLISSCTHCGLCKKSCPESIDMDSLIHSARFRMHKLGKMRWAFNDFFLRDMEFTNSDKAHLCKSGQGNIHSASQKYVFFPGCQLGASSPELVIKSYKYLLSHEPDTGILLNCCGIPAEWAGDEELHNSVLQKIRSDWETLGKPKFILACPTCKNNLAKYLPEIDTIFIYDLMANWGVPNARAKGIYNVFDPCATNAGDNVRASIRKISADLGIVLEPLPIQEKWSACCSNGGHGVFADPKFTKFVRHKRISESNLPYITYCVNCRDAFMHEGKDALHILDLVFDVEPRLETVTKRRHNRIELKEMLLKQFWNESSLSNNADNARTDCTITLDMNDEVRHKISEEYILEEEVINVICFCENKGRAIYNIDKDTFTGYRKIGNLTYWVEYSKTFNPNKFKLLNAYTHRMEIELEMVWNGEKVDIDV